ncbi:hypothetical protein ACP3V3_17035 [Vibrio sp. PNB22_3_1]
MTEPTVNNCRTLAQAFNNQDINWSASLNVLSQEYLLIVTENKPQLSEAQWLALYCVYNGHLPSQDAQREAELLAWHISEGYQFAITLVETINNWTLTQKLSASYWQKASGPTNKLTTNTNRKSPACRCLIQKSVGTKADTKKRQCRMLTARNAYLERQTNRDESS